MIDSVPRLNGYRLVPSPYIPPGALRLPLSTAVKVTPAFRVRFERWSAARFGYEGGQLVVSEENGAIYGHPLTIEAMVREIQRREGDQ